MALKKSELYSKLWASCDELRGGMDASQYKDYVLVLLFVKYVSDKYSGKNGDLEIPKGGSFKDLIALKGDKEIGDKTNKVISKLAEKNDLKGVIDVADFNDGEKLGKGKDMVDRLSRLIAIFESLDFAQNRADGDDLLGDAYEYLMRHFATESGKSKGQFYTPAEVSQIMAKVIGVKDAKSASQTIYDPTCGSGSLLLKAHDEAPYDLTIYGQEMDNATKALAKMNMILHNCPTAEIWQDNTLSTPHFKEKNGKLKLFDYVVANPPFSTKAWSNGFDPANDEYGRFEFGIPPDKNGDYAFMLHILSSLKSTGKGAVILPHGVLFRGGAEGVIRKAAIRQGYIKGIIGLPANLFYGTGIPACIIVLDKEQASTRKGIFMIDASKGFIKDGNKNRLRAQDIHKIVDSFTNQIEMQKFSRVVPVSEIESNDYNLNIPRYIDSTEAEDIQDISAHLNGGIPDADIEALSKYWEVFPSLKSSLFKKGNRKGYSDPKVAPAEVKTTIYSHSEFKTFNQSAHAVFGKWKDPNTNLLKGIKVASNPKELIEKLSESLLESFHPVKLIDPYDIYQSLMNYWVETMQDDVYLLVENGWVGVVDGKPNSDLIPQSLIVRKYFETEAKAIEKLESDRDSITRQIEELDEENGGEDGLLNDAKNEKGKVTKVTVKARLTQIKGKKEFDEERKLLTEYSELIENESVASKKVKEGERELETKAMAQYSKFKEADIKNLVIEGKWLPRLSGDVESELERVSQSLTGRIKELAERYATPLPDLNKQIQIFSTKVDDHLKKMGLSWQ